MVMKRLLILSIVLLVATCAVAFAGCGAKEPPLSLLERCRRAVEEYARQGGYLHFRQELDYTLTTAQGKLEQRITIEGDDIFPDEQKYEYQEAVESTRKPDETQRNSFSYLTLDGGKTAYVKGELLSSQLGVEGWVHYTPPGDQNRYFDFVKLLGRLTGVQGEVEEVGRENPEGSRCVHLRYTISGQELVNLGVKEDTTLQQKFQGMDLSEALGDLLVEIWVGEGDDLPRLIQVRQEQSVEGGVSTTSLYRFTLTSWREEPSVTIEAPASFTEAV
jgi:hypothetical protein